MTARHATRAFERILALTTPDELWALEESARTEVLEAMANLSAVAGPWRDGLAATARRRGVTVAYVVDRTLALRAAIGGRDEPDLYAVLGISPDATPEAIRRRWRELAKRHHPDGGGGPHGEPFRSLHAAYAVLGNPVERLRYDARCGRQGPALPSPPPTSAGRQPAAWHRARSGLGAAVAASVILAGGAMTWRPAPSSPPSAPVNPVARSVEAPPEVAQAPRRLPEPPPPVPLQPVEAPLPPAPPPPVAAAPAAPPATTPVLAKPAAPARKPIDVTAAERFLAEFRRRYHAREALGLLELFASNGAANGRRGVEIAQAYDEFFRRLRPRYTSGWVEVRPTRSGAMVESEIVLTTQGQSPMYGVAYWELVREGGSVRLARLVSSVPAL